MSKYIKIAGAAADPEKEKITTDSEFNSRVQVTV